MRKKILAALLLSVLMDIAACSGTQTCRVSGLTPGQTYMYGYEDGAGNTTIGEFWAPSTTYDIPNVDSSVDCGNIDVIHVVPEMPPPIA